MKHLTSEHYLLRFAETINQLHPIPKDQLRLFLNTFEVIDCAKNTQLLQEGEVCKHLYFIIKGGVRCYKHDEHGKEINLNFYFENQVTSEFKSLQSQTPSQRNLATLAPSRLLRAARSQYLQLIEDNLPSVLATLRFYKERYLEEEEHAEMLRKLTAEERYRYMLINKPHLLQRVTLTHLASWLGISRESLSRIRGKF